MEYTTLQNDKKNAYKETNKYKNGFFTLYISKPKK